jgi:Domain of unknown function (DUF4384)
VAGALLATAGVVNLGELPAWPPFGIAPTSPAAALPEPGRAIEAALAEPAPVEPPPPPPASPIADSASSASGPAPAGAPAVPRPLQATLTSPDGPDPLLRVQDEIRAVLVTTGEAFAYCYYADGAGSISRIFPNRFRPDALVPSGGLQLPDAAGAFSLVAERAGRTEEVRCLAARSDLGSRLPPVLQAEDLAPLAVRSLDEISSMFKSLGEEVAEARLVARVAP